MSNRYNITTQGTEQHDHSWMGFGVEVEATVDPYLGLLIDLYH